MLEQDAGTQYAQGTKPTEVPAAPVAGRAKVEDKSEDGGVPRL
jgi:hypothetical protein